MSDRKSILPALLAPGTLAGILLSAAVLGGCASSPPKAAPPMQDTIVLLADASGKTGSIVVSGGGQEVRLSETNQAVVVREGSPPSKPFVMGDKELSSFAAPALKALPPPPKQFILHFEHNTAVLTEKSRKLFTTVVKTIKERQPVDISVVGHTDTVGDRDYNYRLSYNRARAVADLLVAQGVDRSILDITSHGKENPLIPTGDQVHEPRNRRVEVTVR